MSVMCNPLEHGIEIDEMDSSPLANYVEGGCYKCGCDLRWEFKTYFNTPKAYNNMDIGEVNHDSENGFNPRNVFAVISQVDIDDADLSLYGAYILPYHSVRIIALGHKTKQDQSYSIDYTYDDLRYGKNNYYGLHTERAFSNNSWEKVVKNDIELQQVMAGYRDAINKRKI